MNFDFSFNLGHVIAIGVAISGAFAAWSAATAQIATVDTRTASFASIHDTVLKDTIRVDTLVTLENRQADANDTMVRTLATIQADIAAIKATLATQGRP